MKGFTKYILALLILGSLFSLFYNCNKKSTKENQPPKCSISPTSLVYDTVEVGGSSEKSFTIKNIGGGTLSGSVSEGLEAGRDQYQFVSGSGSYSLGAGESKIVTISFKPTKTGYWTCVTRTGNELCSDVSLSGTGVPPCCSISPDSLNFDTVTVGSSLEKTFTISNCSFSGATLTGYLSLDYDCSFYGYSIVSGSGNFSLGPGQSRTVNVKFAPRSSGYRTCTIHTNSVADACGDVICSGTGK